MVDTILNYGLIFVVVGAAAYAAHTLASLVIKILQPNPVTDYLGTGKKQRGAGQISFSDRAGAGIAGQLPVSLKNLEEHLRWAQRGGAAHLHFGTGGWVGLLVSDLDPGSRILGGPADPAGLALFPAALRGPEDARARRTSSPRDGGLDFGGNGRGGIS